VTQVTMFTGTAARCGIGEYARQLVAALVPLAQVRTVEGRFGGCPRREYRRLGEAMNDGDLAHVQHAYAFWGGMAPHRAGFGAFLGAIRRPVVITVHEFADIDADAARLGAASIAPGGLEGRAPISPAIQGVISPTSRLRRSYTRLFNRLTFASPRIRALMVHAPALQRGLEGLGIPAERIHLLPMPAPRVVRAADDTAFRARWGLEGRFTVTIFGFLARRKGYPSALDALAQLPEPVTLVIAGDVHPADRSDPRGWLEVEAEARGLSERVRFLGYVPADALPELMRASDLVLAPFTAMSASASLHLALAHGRPVLASDLEANRLLPCVDLFPAGDSAALAGAIAALRDDPARRADLAEAALAYTAEHGVERLARETMAIYEEVLRDADRP
jgi:glycosyltransferase involved in cell wall biosynthesis